MRPTPQVTMIQSNGAYSAAPRAPLLVSTESGIAEDLFRRLSGNNASPSRMSSVMMGW